jgi:hypothetical protein
MEAMPADLSNAERFAALSAELRDGPRPLRFDAEAHALSVALRGQHDDPKGDKAVLALPARGVVAAVDVAP